ncbi:MAG: FMN-dependent NADH-azoreductase [Candidatus Azotimanducaceae bacterium]|jgi:FMN-dependent NADH-azoreductase
MTILHINSSARLDDSNTRIIGQYLVDELVSSLSNHRISGVA